MVNVAFGVLSHNTGAESGEKGKVQHEQQKQEKGNELFILKISPHSGFFFPFYKEHMCYVILWIHNSR